jgi:hypothetical protein
VVDRIQQNKNPMKLKLEKGSKPLIENMKKWLESIQVLLCLPKMERFIMLHYLIAKYGITRGSYDKSTNKLALDLSKNLTFRGIADQNTIDGILQSDIKGDVGKINLVRK